MTESYDAVVVGSGINSLVCAAMLAKAGWHVGVFEREAHLGGAVRTEEATLPGFKHDLYSGWHILFLGSEAYRELHADLIAAGLTYVNSDISAASLLPDGSAVFVGRDRDANVAEFERCSQGDGSAWVRAARDFQAHSDLVLGLLGTELWSRAGLALGMRAYRELHARGLVEFMAHALSTGRQWLTQSFRSPLVHALFAPWVLHTGLGPEASSSGLMLQVLSVMLEGVGMPIPVGGGARLIDALATIVRERGGCVESSVDIERVIVEDGRAAGVRTTDGRQIYANRAVVANVTPTQLYGRLLSDVALPDVFRDAIGAYRYGRADMQVHFALRERPTWLGDERLGRSPIVNLTAGLDGVSRAVNEAERGLIPAEPTICVGQPVLLDPSRAPEGKWILWCQLLEMPNPLTGDAAGEIDTGDGTWTEAIREEVAGRVQRRLARHIAGFDELVLKRVSLSPADLERANINLVGGDPYSGALDLEQNLLFRPLSVDAPHQTPVKKLYQIGASTYPGPGLSGASGTLVARTLVREHSGLRHLIDRLQHA